VETVAFLLGNPLNGTEENHKIAQAGTLVSQRNSNTGPRDFFFCRNAKHLSQTLFKTGRQNEAVSALR
jgi:hypothetical protein